MADERTPDIVEMREWAERRRAVCESNDGLSINVQRYSELVLLLDELARLRASQPDLRSLEQLIAAEPGDTPRRQELQRMLDRVKAAHQEKPA